jgi:predicted O-linked N-acetylglucosamine transferase (SPINDLY family)
LGLNPVRHQALRDQVLAKRDASRLFNPVEFARHLEAGLTQAVTRAQSGQKPTTFRVKELMPFHPH